MLSNDKIEDNKVRFLELVRSISRDGINMDLLEKQLINSDFFYAPASMCHHGSYTGGLCEHSLNVYSNLLKLFSSFVKDGLSLSREELDTITIVSLFHDFSKMNYYQRDVKNKKIYSDSGSKQDSYGKYDWVQVDGYSVKPAENRFGIGTASENSVYMTNTFIPLTQEEYCAILNHKEHDENVTLSMWKKCSLSLLLHIADCIASFMQESYE